jgi:hypothetical protein
MTISFTTARSLAAASFLLPLAAHAQTHFSLGPQVGLNVSSATYVDDTYHVRACSGLAAGVVANLHLGSIVTLQSGLQYSQKGYDLNNGGATSASNAGQHDDHYRLNYLTLPFQVVLTTRRDGEGFQFLAGPYLSMLLGGHYDRTLTPLGGQPTYTEGSITPDNSSESFQEYSSARLDYGALAGLGYRFKQLQLQATYSWGWPSLSVDYTYRGQRFNNPNYSNRAFQVSLAYLFALKQ